MLLYYLYSECMHNAEEHNEGGTFLITLSWFSLLFSQVWETGGKGGPCVGNIYNIESSVNYITLACYSPFDQPKQVLTRATNSATPPDNAMFSVTDPTWSIGTRLPHNQALQMI